MLLKMCVCVCVGELNVIFVGLVLFGLLYFMFNGTLLSCGHTRTCCVYCTSSLLRVSFINRTDEDVKQSTLYPHYQSACRL